MNKASILREAEIDPSSNLIVWFDMTDSASIRSHLDTFGDLIRASEPGDIIRMTVDIDEKTFGRKSEGEILEDVCRRRFSVLKEYLGNQLKPGAKPEDIAKTLGIAELVAYAFKLVAEEATEVGNYAFKLLSLTTYADGHRMLSVTGAVLESSEAEACLKRVNPASIPGGAINWENLVNIEIPQLTVWEKLSIDRKIGFMSPKDLAANEIKFRLHDTIATQQLLEGYQTFQRFYPTFRHILL